MTFYKTKKYNKIENFIAFSNQDHNVNNAFNPNKTIVGNTMRNHKGHLQV